MKRPPAETQITREVTGEIIYLDQMRRHNAEPSLYSGLGDMAIQMYEIEADLCKDAGVRPDIMDEYEQHDSHPSEAVASCAALANELFKLKEPNNSLTFVDIAITPKSSAVLEKLRSLRAGSLLAAVDEQLAIDSTGGYYPELDIRKQNARVGSANLRVWSWSHDKYAFTHPGDERPFSPNRILRYPENEKSTTRQIELSFGYHDEQSGGFTESVSLYLNEDGTVAMNRNIWAASYAETGYEGHMFASLDDITDEDVAAFGDLTAELVGDSPESVSTKTDRELQEISNAAATPLARTAIEDLAKTVWPAQAVYILHRTLKGADKPLGEQLSDPTTVESATAAINTYIKKWNALNA